jgi:KUP system potassium uptake protein
VIRLGHDIDSVIATYGYLEQPDVRGALSDLQRARKLDIAAERWIVEVGEEDVILDPQLSLLQRLRVAVFRWTLKLSTPAHKYLGLVYDAALSKEVIPVTFGPTEARSTCPNWKSKPARKKPTG